MDGLCAARRTATFQSTVGAMKPIKSLERLIPVRTLLWIVLLIPILYVSTCSYTSHRQATAFDTIDIGDIEKEVVGAIGVPSRREKAGHTPFARYSSVACVDPCSERLWYENRLAFVGEAWSVELDAGGRVIRKSRWMSP